MLKQFVIDRCVSTVVSQVTSWGTVPSPLPLLMSASSVAPLNTLVNSAGPRYLQVRALRFIFCLILHMYINTMKVESLVKGHVVSLQGSFPMPSVSSVGRWDISLAPVQTILVGSTPEVCLTP